MIAYLLGLVVSAIGVLLIMRFGLTFEVEPDFADPNIEPVKAQRHGEQLWGRFGFGIVILGVMVQIAAGILAVFE